MGDCLVREVDDELLQLDGQVRRPVAFDLSSAGGREHPTPQALAYRERTPEPVAAIRTCVDSAANWVGVVGGMTADGATARLCASYCKSVSDCCYCLTMNLIYSY